jgi:hypothetical protein
MDWDLSALIAYLRDNPLTAMSCALGLALGLYLLQRRPPLQRDADEHLATLGKSNAGRYDRLRPLE